MEAIGRLSAIEALAFVLVGEYDLSDFHEIADVIAAKIPNATKSMVRGAGHVASMERPDQVTSDLLQFSRRHAES